MNEIFRAGLTQDGWCPYEKTKVPREDRDAPGECHVEMEAEIGGRFTSQGTPETASKPPEAGTASPPQAQKEPALPVWDCEPLEVCENEFLFS